MSAILSLLKPRTLKPVELPDALVTGLYVHVPFCFHKCHYCDFYSITRQTPDRMAKYVDLALREADLWADSSVRLMPKTVFFGGGTPTLLPVDQMARLIEGLKSRFDFSRCDEWTIEANPATVTPDYCRMLKSLGINRLSFGAQSFDAAELAILERHHNPADVAKSVEMARDAGFTRLNLDLIYAIPGQSIESWLRSLRTALEQETPHLSCYGLTFESNTPIAVRRRLGQIRSIEETLELQMFRATRAVLLESGRPAYEISNYCVPGDECRHNLLYWTGGNYLGLGPSAASHVQGWRWRNRPHLGEWEQSIESGNLPSIEIETLSPLHRAGELAMLLLRLSRGLIFTEFSDRTGYDAREVFSGPISQLTPPGLIRLSDKGITLTDNGLAVADSIAGEFLRAALQLQSTGQPSRS